MRVWPDVVSRPLVSLLFGARPMAFDGLASLRPSERSGMEVESLKPKCNGVERLQSWRVRHGRGRNRAGAWCGVSRLLRRTQHKCRLGEAQGKMLKS
jgi:hypothetical protein